MALRSDGADHVTLTILLYVYVYYWSFLKFAKLKKVVNRQRSVLALNCFSLDLIKDLTVGKYLEVRAHRRNHI